MRGTGTGAHGAWGDVVAAPHGHHMDRVWRVYGCGYMALKTKQKQLIGPTHGHLQDPKKRRQQEPPRYGVLTNARCLSRLEGNERHDEGAVKFLEADGALLGGRQ